MAFEKLQAADDKGMFKAPVCVLVSTGRSVLSSEERKWGMRTAPTSALTAAFTHKSTLVSDACRQPESFGTSELLLSGPMVNEFKPKSPFTVGFGVMCPEIFLKLSSFSELQRQPQQDLQSPEEADRPISGPWSHSRDDRTVTIMQKH